MNAVSGTSDYRKTSRSRSQLRLLTFSTLYPNAVQHRHGIFVEQRLRQLLRSGAGNNAVETKVVAPVPWFPLPQRRFGRYGEYARVPADEYRHGIDVYHPRYPVIPRIGMHLAPGLLAAAVKPTLRRLRQRGFDFQLIDAHYFYPDGVAAVALGRQLGVPVTVTARGSDLNLIADFPLPRRMIRWAAAHSAGLITVKR